MSKQDLKQRIARYALELGFDQMGVSKAGLLDQEARDLEAWLKQGLHGTMYWMEGHFDKRIDPRKLVDGAKSVITLTHNYYPEPAFHQPTDLPKISKYAWGLDYHAVLKRKMHLLLDFIRSEAGNVEGRVFVDSAPVMDKAWAKRGGLGWIGKNTNLIHPKRGSFFFIGEIICDLELESDAPMRDYCGTCTKCIDACPTEALKPYQIDSNKCISYLTIELREKMPESYRGNTQNWVYGCDICQDVCPWNRFSKANSGEDFRPLDGLLARTPKEWRELGEKNFKKFTKHSAMSRVRYEKFLDNLDSVVHPEGE